MMWRTGILFIAFFALSASTDTFAPGLAPDRDLDALLLQLSARYHKALPAHYYQQPYSYRDIASFFETLEDSTLHLSAEERYRISRAIYRFGPDSALYHFRSQAKDGIRLKANVNFLGSVLAGYRDSMLTRLSGIINPSFAANMGRLSFYSGINVWTEYRSDTLFTFPSYQPYDGIAYNLYGRNTVSGSVRSSDLPHGGVSYDAGRIRIDAAIDYLRCGPSRYFPLTLSGDAPPLTFARVAADLEVLRYTHIAGLLKSQKDERKYLFMHRLEGDAWHNRLHYGINEVVVYGNTTSQPHAPVDSIDPVYVQGNRSVDPEYLIPFLPFKFIEHFDGDRDNAAVSCDITLFWPEQWCLYGEFLLDDMLSPWKLFTNDWGNKWAATIGATYAGTLYHRPCTFTAEMSRVEPWVYTHFGGGSHRYTHFNRGLGSPMGPNSFAAKVVALLQWSRRNEFGIGVDVSAKNTTTRGGSITDVFQHPDPVDSLRFHDETVKKFLGEGTVLMCRPVLYWNYDVFGRFAVLSNIAVDLAENRGGVYLSLYGGLYF